MAKLVHLMPLGGNLYMASEVSMGHPDQGLPGGGGHPGQLPTIPGVPDNTLPTTPPPTVPSGMYLVMVRTPDGKWKWATVSSMPPVIDNTLPTPPPPTPGTPLPPTAAPKS